MSFKVKYVNGLMSNKNSLYTASVLPAVPESYCIDLALATPTWLPAALPLVEVMSSNKPKVLYAVVSPLTAPISGVLYRFVIFAKLPISKVVIPALTAVSYTHLTLPTKRIV